MAGISSSAMNIDSDDGDDAELEALLLGAGLRASSRAEAAHDQTRAEAGALASAPAEGVFDSLDEADDELNSLLDSSMQQEFSEDQPDVKPANDGMSEDDLEELLEQATDAAGPEHDALPAFPAKRPRGRPKGFCGSLQQMAAWRQQRAQQGGRDIQAMPVEEEGHGPAAAAARARAGKQDEARVQRAGQLLGAVQRAIRHAQPEERRAEGLVPSLFHGACSIWKYMLSCGDATQQKLVDAARHAAQLGQAVTENRLCERMFTDQRHLKAISHVAAEAETSVYQAARALTRCAASSVLSAGVLWGGLFNAVLERCQAGSLQPVMLMKSFRYDESPQKVRLESNECEVGTFAALREIPKHGKVMQSEMGIAFLLRDVRAGQYIHFSGAWAKTLT